MSEYQWIDIGDRYPGAYKAKGIDAGDYRVTVVWTLNPGIKQHNQVRATLSHKGGSVWMVEKKFQRYHSAFDFFWRMQGQAEIRLSKLS